MTITPIAKVQSVALPRSAGTMMAAAIAHVPKATDIAAAQAPTWPSLSTSPRMTAILMLSAHNKSAIADRREAVKPKALPHDVEIGERLRSQLAMSS